ncbi:UNVERIFIED_ORG: hypothetical protein [Escherichia phage CMSTMSU]
MEIDLNLKTKKPESVGDPTAIEGQAVAHKTCNEMLAAMNRNK